MPVCSKCHDTKDGSLFYGVVRVRGVCRQCRKTDIRAQKKASMRTWLRTSYAQCKMRHARNKYEGVLLPLASFLSVFAEQDGDCAETGVRLTTEGGNMASPDRVDNDRGYVEGNVRFVTWNVNRARGNMDIRSFRKLCALVAGGAARRKRRRTPPHATPHAATTTATFA